MAKIHYGNGECSIIGSEIRGVEITYSGSPKIIKTANDNFRLIYNNSKILIFPIGEGCLTDLFYYRGRLRIKSVLVADNSGERVGCGIKAIVDYAELINTNAEDMTMLSENMKVGYGSSRRGKIEEMNNTTIENLHSDGEFYLEDGTQYTGLYHIHIADSSAMTGEKHTEKSQDLYFKPINPATGSPDRLTPTRNTSNTLPVLKIKKKKRRK